MIYITISSQHDYNLVLTTQESENRITGHWLMEESRSIQDDGDGHHGVSILCYQL